MRVINDRPFVIRAKDFQIFKNEKKSAQETIFFNATKGSKNLLTEKTKKF